MWTIKRHLFSHLAKSLAICNAILLDNLKDNDIIQTRHFWLYDLGHIYNKLKEILGKS